MSSDSKSFKWQNASNKCRTGLLYRNIHRTESVRHQRQQPEQQSKWYIVWSGLTQTPQGGCCSPIDSRPTAEIPAPDVAAGTQQRCLRPTPH